MRYEGFTIANGLFACAKILCRLLPQSFLPVGSEIQLPPGGSLGLGGHLTIEVKVFFTDKNGRMISSPTIENEIYRLEKGLSCPWQIIISG